jgi:hypothetical protein
MKKCNDCLQTLDFSKFHKFKSSPDGFQYKCKTCINLLNKEKYNKVSYQKHKKQRNLESKEWKKNNPEKKKAMDKIYYENNKEKIKEKQKLISKKWNNLNYKNNPQYKISSNLRTRFRQLLKKNKINKNNSIIYLLGCSIEELKLYLEKQFKPEMIWENYGKIWEIDHIKPCVSFDLTDLEQQKECFHHTNLQPLFKTTEIAKSFGYINEIGNRNKYSKY